MFDGMDQGLVVGTSVDEDGFVETQVDVYGEKKAGAQFGETCFPAGLYGRPHDPVLDPAGEPDAARATGASYSYFGGRQHVWPEHDPRFIAALPRDKAKGSFYFYGGASTAPAWLEARAAGAGSEMHGVADKWTFRGALRLEGAGTEMFGEASRWAFRGAFAFEGAFTFDAAGAEVGGVADRWALRGPVVLGADAATSPVALATPLGQYIDALEAAIKAGFAAISPPTSGSPAVAVFEAAMALVATLKTQVPATRVKAV